MGQKIFTQQDRLQKKKSQKKLHKNCKNERTMSAIL